jgi:V/A-type H+-transporting ATPase subunit E
MGLDKVIERIQSEADVKIKGILQDAEKQAAEILQQKQRSLDELAILRRQEIEKQIETLRHQEESRIEIEVKKIRLNAEKDLLDLTYKECLSALQSLPSEKILVALLQMIHSELPEAEAVYSNKRDEKILRSLTPLSSDGSLDCLGGIIAENHEKTLKVDYRYEVIAALVWDQSLKEIAEHLFR